MTPEGLVKRELRKLLNSIGAYSHWPVPVGYGRSSLDVLVCYKGRFYGVECKREGVGKPSDRQACVMREIAEAGGGVCLENTTELKNVKKLLGLDQRKSSSAD